MSRFAYVGVLVFVIQTPGVSQFFGCRPLGPVGWGTAVGASLTATGASLALPWAAEQVGGAIASHRPGAAAAGDEPTDLDLALA